MNEERERVEHVQHVRIQMIEEHERVEHLKKEITRVEADVPLRNQVNEITEVDENKTTFDLLCDLYDERDGRCPKV